ncbi:MAG: hypothetical protein C0408_03510 [Odoribacter sp.]|nr:hypothetical protein [Odoribacter sp.]
MAPVILKGFNIQDTLKQKNIPLQDTIKQLPDTANKIKVSGDTALPVKANYIHPVAKTEPQNTILFCKRSSIADVTFHDSANIITQIDVSVIQNFPFVFTGINREKLEETKADLIKQLKSGDELPAKLFHNDWILPAILFLFFIYGVIKSESGKFFQGMQKFISFRGINESASRDIGSLYQWQSTLFNLASFLNIGLFVSLTAVWYNVLPSNGKSFIYWMISSGIVIAALTLRHFVCIITGNLSGEKEIFREHLIGIYQAYRVTGLFLFVLTILILYTTFIPLKTLFYTGFCLTALSYLARVSRLFLIFINRHVSIVYLILYLCALEILPVVILIKYVTGLV